MSRCQAVDDFFFFFPGHWILYKCGAICLNQPVYIGSVRNVTQSFGSLCNVIVEAPRFELARHFDNSSAWPTFPSLPLLCQVQDDEVDKLRERLASVRKSAAACSIAGGTKKRGQTTSGEGKNANAPKGGAAGSRGT